MKRILLITACLLAGMSGSWAAVVPQERAAAVAASFFKAGSAVTKSSAQPAIRLVASYPDVPTKSSSSAPTLYVYERETEGFVLIAGDDAARPVLGYSMTGHFPTDEQMPVNLKDLLNWYSTVLYRARVMGWKPSASIRNQWEQPTTAAPASSPVKLATATWNQGFPYNNLCPRVDGQECPCGCVATAMAIIMRYHSWPERGTGTLPSYDFGWDYERNAYKCHVDGFPLGHLYEWDKMSVSGNFTQEGEAQVARLCYDLGVMCQMDYSPEGSGAASDSPIGLARYFGYDKQMRYYDREYFSDEHWEELIRDEIDAGRPVFHCGVSGDGGHAFVLDGYNDRYFSINYGWGGYANAYYTMTPIEGHREDLTEFNKWQDMVTHIMPDQGGAPYVNLYSYGFAGFGWDFHSDSFLMPGLNFAKYSSTGDGPTELCYCLYDRDGRFKEILCDPFVIGEGNPVKAPSVTCKAPSQPAEGDRIEASRRDDKGQWTPLPGSERESYLEFKKDTPLSELVSVGHTYGRVRNWSFSNPATVFIQAYKDIYWELRTREGRVLMTSADVSDKGLIYVDDRYFQFAWEFANDTYARSVRERPYFEFIGLDYLDYGEYTLYFRNFSEEMTLHITK